MTHYQVIIKKVHVWFSELERLSNVRIPRSLQQKYTVISQFTHCRYIAKGIWSSDYERIQYEDQLLSVKLIAAKTKVAPIQSVSIPRLELMGACLGNKSTQSVAQVFSIPIKEVVFWSDSTNVLWWIKGVQTICGQQNM